MSSTSQAVSSPKTAAKVVSRQRPEVRIAPRGPPSEPTFVRFYHPANGCRFLTLPAYDCCPPSFGIHYGTAITACQILACNENGYLSTSRNRDADGRVTLELDSIIPSGGKYYYHLDSPKSEVLYPICHDFSLWEFPHESFPLTWKYEHRKQPSVNWPTNWSAISQRTKDRDAACLVSEWTDSLTTSHTVAKTEEDWLVKNGMDVYLLGHEPLHHDSRNLFTLRFDLRLAQFDQARFVIVPKSGQLVVHFLQLTEQSAQQYHNVQFDHKGSLSHELLYARFAWALMKIVKNTLQNPKKFNLLRGPETIQVQRNIEGTDHGSGGGSKGGGGEGDQSGDGGKRKRDEDGHHTYTSGPSGNLRKRVTSDACPREDGSEFLLDRETQELEEDMKKAARTLPFFVDPNREADAGHFENIVWYPGKAAVERRKQAYLDAHPQIRAHSGRLLPDDYNSSDDENWT